MSGQLLKQGTQGSPQTEPRTCWSAPCGTSPSCEAPRRQVLPRLLIVQPERRQGCGSGSERLAVWKERGFLEPCMSVLVPEVALSFQSCSPFSWVRYSTREDGDVDPQEVGPQKGTQSVDCGEREADTWTWTQERRKLKKIPRVGKELACNAGDPGSIPGSGRSPGGGHGHPLRYPCLETPMDRGACGLQSTGSQRNAAERLALSVYLSWPAATGGPAPTHLLALSVIPLLQPSGESKRAGWVSCLAGASLPLSHQGSRWLTSVVGVVGAYGRFSLCVSSVDLLSFSC